MFQSSVVHPLYKWSNYLKTLTIILNYRFWCLHFIFHIHFVYTKFVILLAITYFKYRQGCGYLLGSASGRPGSILARTKSTLATLITKKGNNERKAAKIIEAWCNDAGLPRLDPKDSIPLYYKPKQM